MRVLQYSVSNKKNLKSRRVSNTTDYSAFYDKVLNNKKIYFRQTSLQNQFTPPDNVRPSSYARKKAAL